MAERRQDETTDVWEEASEEAPPARRSAEIHRGRRRSRWGWVLASVALLGVGGGVFWWWIGQPLYIPGDVASRTDLVPPSSPPGTASSGATAGVATSAFDATPDPDARPPGDTSSRWQVTQDIQLHHLTYGHGRPVLVVHGGPGMPPAATAPAFRSLSGYAVHSYHQRGCGLSSRPFQEAGWGDDVGENIRQLESTLGIGAQLADMERIRRLLGEEQLLIVGHSYGALLAALYAAEFPDRVERLVLIAPANLLLFPSEHGDLFQLIRAHLPATRHQEFDAWTSRYLDLVGAFSYSTEELVALDRQLIPFFEEATGPLPEAADLPPAWLGVWHLRAQFFSMGMRHDWRDFLSAVRAPTLVIHGAEDLQPLAVAEMYGEAITGAAVVTLDEAGHFPQVTHPAPLASMVARFLDGAPNDHR